MIWLLHWLFPWEPVFEAGVWLYEQHRRTGARRAIRINSGGWSPRDEAWLGRRLPTQTVPPRGL